jgi:hypothetical protein
LYCPIAFLHEVYLSDKELLGLAEDDKGGDDAADGPRDAEKHLEAEEKTIVQRPLNSRGFPSLKAKGKRQKNHF